MVYPLINRVNERSSVIRSITLFRFTSTQFYIFWSSEKNVSYIHAKYEFIHFVRWKEKWRSPLSNHWWYGSTCKAFFPRRKCSGLAATFMQIAELWNINVRCTEILQVVGVFQYSIRLIRVTKFARQRASRDASTYHMRRIYLRDT